MLVLKVIKIITNIEVLIMICFINISRCKQRPLCVLKMDWRSGEAVDFCLHFLKDQEAKGLQVNTNLQTSVCVSALVSSQ